MHVCLLVHCAQQCIRVMFSHNMGLHMAQGDHGCTIATHSPLTSEDGSSNPVSDVGKLVAAYRWLAVYSTEP